MKQVLCYYFSITLLLWTFAQTAVAEQTPSVIQKALLYPATPSAELHAVVERIQTAEMVPYESLSPNTQYYVRIAPRKYVVNAENQLLDTAILGTKPFIFITTPEGIYGKSLLEIYLDIGYEAEDIVHWQRNQEMVAIVFRYPDSITPSTVQTGELPTEWYRYVYIPTWDNIFALFEQLSTMAAVLPGKANDFAPNHLTFNSLAEKRFILGFPAAGKQRIKTVPYRMLESVGGSDWAYRHLLERKLSIFEHFRGNGRTLNEVVDPKGIKHEAGLFEFVGPNSVLVELPEVAVIYLGALTIQDLFQ